MPSWAPDLTISSVSIRPSAMAFAGDCPHRRDQRHFTAHGGNPDAIAVMGDAGDNALDQTDIDGIIQRSETQRVEQRDRSGSHGEDVPQDPANPGGGTLEGLHRGWVVMTFNLEGQPMAIPQIDHASVFTGAHQDPRSVRWKATQQRP